MRALVLRSSSAEAICPIVPAEKIEIQTLVCPSGGLEPEGLLQLVMVDGDNEETTLAVFKVPPPQKGAGLTSTRTAMPLGENTCNSELVVEYRRRRVHSTRNAKDEEWDHCSGLVHLKHPLPDTLRIAIAAAEHEYRVHALESKKANILSEIEKKKHEEMRLQLALVDVRGAVANLRSEVIEVERALILELETSKK